jgi:hypothetical protein
VKTRRIATLVFAALLGGAAASWATWRIAARESGAARRAEPVAAPTVASPSGVRAPDASALVYASVERLAREKADREAEVEALRARLAEMDGELGRTREDLEELRRPLAADVLSAAVRAELVSGEVVVTGGYALPDGTRVYAFVQPRIEQVDGREVVRIASTFRTLGDEVGRAAGLESVATNAANTLQHGEVWLEDEHNQVSAALDAGEVGGKVPGPELVLAFGESGRVEAGPLRLKVTPTRGATPDGLDVEVRLEQTPAAVERDSGPAGDSLPR